MTLDIWYASFHISCSVRVSCLFYSFEKGCTVCLLHRIGPTVKNPPETRLEKFVKLTDYSCDCNDLTNFGYAEHAMTGNRNNVNLQKLSCKNSWNHLFPANYRLFGITVLQLAACEKQFILTLWGYAKQKGHLDLNKITLFCMKFHNKVFAFFRM